MATGPIINLRGLPGIQPPLESTPGQGIGRSPSPAIGPAGNVNRPFAAFLEEQITKVNEVQKEADTAVSAMATGRSNNIHEMMIALDKADVSFRMLTKVRNKAMDAYQEIMRMPV